MPTLPANAAALHDDVVPDSWFPGCAPGEISTGPGNVEGDRDPFVTLGVTKSLAEATGLTVILTPCSEHLAARLARSNRTVRWTRRCTSIEN